MNAQIIRANGTAAEVAAELRSLVPDGASVASAVSAIVADVKAAGDAAVLRYTKLHDTRGAEPLGLRVSEQELATAHAQIDPAVAAGIELALANVTRVASAAVHHDVTVDFADHTVSIREAPVKRAAVYVPGGRAPYPSTVVMGVATARAAGVENIAVCSPPGADGNINPVILGACVLAGADEVYRMGGAHAIAALAYGTETVNAVDVIVGPGNLFVQEAKRQLSGRIGIDSFAGPSDLLAIVDGDYPLEPVALDLIAQAEHGAGAAVVCVSPDAALLAALQERLAQDLHETEAICRLVEVPSHEFAFELAEAFAPEHLELLGPLAEQLAPRITHTGCLFVGTGTAFGDYIAGSNHTLPTSGAARFASALGPQHFRRVFTEVRIDDHSALARAAAPIARAEGFEFHARSMEIRIRDNQQP
jgi:histidinol dehydrogenase